MSNSGVCYREVLQGTITTMIIEPPTYYAVSVISGFQNLNRILPFTKVYNIGSMWPLAIHITSVLQKKEFSEETDDLGR